MRSLCILAGLVVLPLSFAGGQTAAGKKVIGPADAIKLAKEREVTVEMVVKSVYAPKDKAHWYLHSEADWKSPKNFTAYIPKSAVEEFKKNNITDPVAAFKDKTIQVTGYLSMHKVAPDNRPALPQIVLHGANNLKVK